MVRRRIETWRDPVTGRPKDPVPTPPSQLCGFYRQGVGVCGASKGLHRNIAEGGDHNWTRPSDLGTQVDAAEVAETLSAKDRNDLARHECAICGAKLLTIEVGRHYRLKHPDDRPEVRPL